MTNLNFVFSDENNLPKATLVTKSRVLGNRDDKNMIKNSIHTMWKAALHKVIHKIAPECPEHQVDHAVTKITRKTVS